MLTRSLRSAMVQVSKNQNQRLFSTTTTTTSEDIVKKELRDNILYVTFNRPAVFNAMTVEMGEKFEELVKYTQESVKAENPEDVVKCVIFSGAGKAFSAGGDRDFLFARHHDKPVNNMAEMTKFYRRFLTVRDIPVPTIAAINGPCVGAGACFTLACDLRIALDTAKIGFIFTKIGLHPGLGATHFLPKLIGHQAAAKLLLTGETINGKKAESLGLVGECITSTNDIEQDNKLVLERATEIAKQMSDVHCTASYTLLRTLRAQLGVGLESALLREADAQAACYNEQYYHDAVVASISKNTRK